MKIKYLLLAFICLLLAHGSNGQAYDITHLTVKTGLPSNKVYYVFHDSKGFIWFCTEVGVVRYDGTNMDTYTIEDGLADNDILFCFEDMWQRIWFASYNGQISFFENEKFYNSKNCAFIPDITQSRVKHIAAFVQNDQDSSFNIIHSEPQNTYYKFFKNKSYKTIAQMDTNAVLFYVKDELVYCITVERIKGTIVSSITKNGLRLIKGLEPGKNSQAQLIPPSNTHDLHWVKVKNKLYKLDADFSMVHLEGEKLINYSTTKQDTIFAYSDGLVVKSLGTSSRYLNNKFVTSLCTGSLNAFYASTYNSGIYIFVKKRSPIKSLTTEIKSVSHNEKNTFLLSTKGKIYSSHNQFGSPKELPQNNSYELNYLYKNKHLFLTQYAQIWSMDLSGNLPNFLHKKEGSDFKQNCIFKGHIYSQFKSQIRVVDIEKNHAVFHKKNIGRFYGLMHSHNKVWTYGNGGIFEIATDSLVLIDNYKTLNIFKATLIEGDLFYINHDDYKLYIHKGFANNPTGNSKVFLELRKVQDIKKISPVSFIIQDQKGSNQLLTKKNGAYKINELDFAARYIPLHQIHSDSTKLFIAGNGRTSIYYLDSLVLPNWDPVVISKQLIVSDSAYLVSEGRNFIKRSNEGKITIRFTVRGAHGSRNYYQYAILSNNTKDTVWNTINKPEIELLNPNWGKYNIIFRTTYNEKIYSKLALVKLEIQPPIYLRIWFVIFIISLLILLTYLITSYLRLQKQKKLLYEKEAEKINLSNEFKALNALMNPHFIFNSLNTIQNLIAKDKEKANEYLITFSDLVRQNMQNIKQELIGLDKEIDLVRNYLELEKLRFKDKLNYTINIDDTIFLNETELPPLSVQPIVENCIKHGIMPLKEKNGKIVINVTEHANYVAISVMDNGIGFNKSDNKEGSQSALKNIKQRFEVLSKIHNIAYTFDVKAGDKESEFKNVVILKIPYE